MIPARRRGPQIAFLSFLSVMVAATAAAAEPIARIAIVRLDFEGGLVEGSRELFQQRLVEGLKAVQFEVVAGSGAAAGTPPGTPQNMAAEYQVVGKVAASNKTYDITLELINGRTARSIGTNRERCEICGVEEAGEKMGLAASALRARLEALMKTPARFIIRSRPPGAVAVLDGQALGRTPIDREIVGGPHKLTLTSDGYSPMERTFTAVSSVDEVLDLDLVRVPSRFPYRTAGWIAIATGAALVAAGLWAVAIDGDEIACPASERDILDHCPKVRSTRLLGALLAGTGAVSATLGGVWLYFGAVSSRGSTRNADTRSGAGLFLRVTF
ncbi:MAG TPA: PEGA domain-containing protein [Polyangia bacterium]|nr:PEGA domain-containing protein [Polyangia bacterium]